MAYLDFGGSGAETIAHLQENGRITLMWCAFDGPPTIVRVHGRGEPVFRDDPRFEALLTRFDACRGGLDAERGGGLDAERHGLRAIILVTAVRISDSCGFAVPLMDFRAERTLHGDYFARKSDPEFAAYCESKPYVGNSLDGLPALPLPLPPRTG